MTAKFNRESLIEAVRLVTELKEFAEEHTVTQHPYTQEGVKGLRLVARAEEFLAANGGAL